MDLGLKDRVHIVTGGTRGLGLAAARELTPAVRSRHARRSGAWTARSSASAARRRAPRTPLATNSGRASFESGFLGAMRLSRAVAAQLAEGGVIGFVLSTSVYEPIPASPSPTPCARPGRLREDPRR